MRRIHRQAPNVTLEHPIPGPTAIVRRIDPIVRKGSVENSGLVGGKQRVDHLALQRRALLHPAAAILGEDDDALLGPNVHSASFGHGFLLHLRGVDGWVSSLYCR